MSVREKKEADNMTQIWWTSSVREGALAGKSGDGDRSEGGESERGRVKPRRNHE